MLRRTVPVVFLILGLAMLARPSLVQKVSATHVTNTTVYADFNGFNFTFPSGPNPAITVLSNSTLRLGPLRLSPSFTVTVRWVNSFHNFHVLTATGVSIGVSDTVSSGATSTSKTFTLSTGLYTYRCDFHPAAMHGTIKAINPDVDGDGDVDIDDLVAVYIHQFGTNLAYDIDLDGDVDIDDLIIVYTHQFIQ